MHPVQNRMGLHSDDTEGLAVGDIMAFRVCYFVSLFFKQVLYWLFIPNTNPTLDILNLSGVLQTRDVSVTEDQKAQSPPRDTDK